MAKNTFERWLEKRGRASFDEYAYNLGQEFGRRARSKPSAKGTMTVAEAGRRGAAAVARNRRTREAREAMTEADLNRKGEQ